MKKTSALKSNPEKNPSDSNGAGKKPASNVFPKIINFTPLEKSKTLKKSSFWDSLTGFIKDRKSVV